MVRRRNRNTGEPAIRICGLQGVPLHKTRSSTSSGTDATERSAGRPVCFVSRQPRVRPAARSRTGYERGEIHRDWDLTRFPTGAALLQWFSNGAVIGDLVSQNRASVVGTTGNLLKLECTPDLRRGPSICRPVRSRAPPKQTSCPKPTVPNLLTQRKDR